MDLDRGSLDVDTVEDRTARSQIRSFTSIRALLPRVSEQLLALVKSIAFLEPVKKSVPHSLVTTSVPHSLVTTSVLHSLVKTSVLLALVKTSVLLALVKTSVLLALVTTSVLLARNAMTVLD